MSCLARIMAPSVAAEGVSPAKRRRVLFRPAVSKWGNTQLWNSTAITELATPVKGCRTSFNNNLTQEEDLVDSDDDKELVGENSQSHDERPQNSELAPRADPFDGVLMRSLSPTQRSGLCGRYYAESIAR